LFDHRDSISLAFTAAAGGEIGLYGASDMIVLKRHVAGDEMAPEP
jgi:hypothetical protein